MGVAKQLYQLQELDSEIEANEWTLSQIARQLGESEAVVTTQNQLQLEQQHLEELKHKQRSAEWEIDDVITKLKATEEKLFSGEIKNPKELANLQHEVDALKDRRDQREEKALEIIDQVELAEASVAKKDSELETLKTDWQRQQQQLSNDLERFKAILSDLKRKRQLLADEIDPQVIEFYQELRKEKGIAVAKVEQGICRGCRISLPVTELHQARSGNLVQCSSCGRILFLA
jgi:predicted  nucleic acid-binding Zn-ribbon protein